MDPLIVVQDALDVFLQSHVFWALKVFLGIYTIVLVIDIVLILSFRNFRHIMNQNSYGTEFVPTLSKSAMKKKWSKIEERLRSGNLSEYKVAVLEADNIVEGILNDVGYNSGSDMSQKIEMLRAMQPEDAALLDEVHGIRNRIVFEQDFHLDADQTRKALETYKTYLKKFDYFQ